MKQPIIIILFALCCQWSFSQDEVVKETDSLYKEDQFYAGVTYNLLGKTTNGVSQSGFSTGFYLGYIKDMPINKNRNVAIGIGLGFATNSFNQNILIAKDVSGNPIYSVLDGTSGGYSKNKFSTNTIELPIEFRWRSSNGTDYEFWRIYTGFKLGYMFAHAAKFNGDLGSYKYSDINDFNEFQYGLTLSAGYNTWNVYIYYGLNSIFNKDAILNGESLDMNEIKIGLMFYIL
jgi:hypothetical protein